MQNIVIYPGAILELQTTLMHLKKHKVFLVTGKKSFESCGAKEKLHWLFDTYDVTHFYDFQTNPDSNDVINGVQLFNHAKSELIVSVGGGSVIDMAKLINYYHKAGINVIEERNIEINNPELVTHISLPTTAGSGAEATHFAVMYISNTKYSVSHPKLTPDFAIIDPELHYSQTPYQKAVSGVDALAQSIESFWSILATDESKVYSRKALELIWNNLSNVVNSCDKIAHLKMSVGSNLAGKAINIAKTTAPHAMAYTFTKKIGIPHGHAVALTLPYFFALNLDDYDVNNNLSEVKLNIFKIINCESVIDGKKKISNFLNMLKLETRLSNLSILNKKDFYSISQNVNVQRLANNPRYISVGDIEKVIEEIY